MREMSSNFIEIHRHTPARPWTYFHLDQRQRAIAQRIHNGGLKGPGVPPEIQGTLLLSEVAPVITYGRRTPSEDLTQTPAFLQEKGIQVLSVDRGGLATYHGPGQWLLFPVDRLESLTGDRKGVRKAVEGLLTIAWECGRVFDSGAHIRQGCELGVWTSRGGKFASVGIHIEKGVLLHGLCVNGWRTPLSFYGLRPCGLDAPMDFLLSTPSESDFLVLGEQLLSVASKILWGSGLTQSSRAAITHT